MKKRCFVVMGFGTKTDLATGRKIDLDKSYKNLIKPVVEGNGIAYVRADEIPHSGVIDVPMYAAVARESDCECRGGKTPMTARRRQIAS